MRSSSRRPRLEEPVGIHEPLDCARGGAHERGDRRRGGGLVGVIFSTRAGSDGRPVRARLPSAECARLVALGAVRVRLLPADGDNEACLVMQDIEGNEFDLD